MDVTDVIGPMGRHQIKTLAVVSLRPVTAVFAIFATQFSSMQIDHWCSPTEDFRNFSSTEWQQCCLPETEQGKHSNCEYYGINREGNITNQTISCSKWDFDESAPYKSIREEYDLVCSRAWYISFLYLSFTVGSLIAYVPAGHLADKYGRKPLSLLGPIALTIVSVATYFSTSVEYLLVVRFLHGIAFGIFQNALMCLLTEAMGPEHRSAFIIPFNGSWGLGIMLMAGLGYFIKDWRNLIILSSFPFNLPLFVLIWKLVPESSRWLLSVKQYKKAEEQILLQAKENGITIVDIKSVMEGLKKKVQMDKEQQGNYNFLDLLRNRYLLRVTMVVYTSFFITVLVYHGFTISVGQLDVSLHLNFFLTGLIEVFSIFPFLYFTKRISRRKSLLIAMVLGGVSFLVTIPIGKDLEWLRIALAMFGRFCNTLVLSLLYLFSNEIFPTSLRVVGVSGGMAAGRLGSILASFTDDMGRVYGRTVPLAMYGVLLLLSSAIFLLLPETSHKHLPDTVVETRMLARKAKAGVDAAEEITLAN